ncbi:MAG: hypothetical protein WKG00_14230 [Polyangiaceae bacterium]
MRRFAALFAVLAVGCGVDPLPEPPAPAPQLLGDFDGGVCSACDGQASVSGASGSVVDADSVWAVNLDREAPPVVVPVASDGSFGLFLPAIEGDEIRIQARRDDLRSTPLDLVMLVAGGVDEAPRPLSDCFVLPLELAFADTAIGGLTAGSVRIEHGCAAPLQVDAVVLRAPSSDFSVSVPTLPIVLAPGEFLDVAIDFSPPGAGLREEVLLIEVSQPEVDRRPITLFGRAP